MSSVTLTSAHSVRSLRLGSWVRHFALCAAVVMLEQVPAPVPVLVHVPVPAPVPVLVHVPVRTPVPVLVSVPEPELDLVQERELKPEWEACPPTH